MKKNDLKLIGAFIDNKNPKPELNFGLIKQGVIYATDTRKAIGFRFDKLNKSGLIHKKVLKGFESFLSKDERFDYQDGYFFTNLVKFAIDGAFSFEQEGEIKGIHHSNYPDLDDLLNIKLPYHFKLETLDDIAWELTQKNCFIDDMHLNPIISFNECTSFDIFYRPQEARENESDTGMVKIVGLAADESGTLDVAFTAVITGRKFESKASE